LLKLQYHPYLYLIVSLSHDEMLNVPPRLLDKLDSVLAIENILKIM